MLEMLHDHHNLVIMKKQTLEQTQTKGKHVFLLGLEED